MPTFRVNRGVDPQQISNAIGSIADAFKPITPQEMYAGAKAKQTQQQSDYLAEAYRLARDPNASQDLRDRIGSIAGAFTPNQSLTAIDRNNANALAQTRLQQEGETARNANTVRGSTIVGLFPALNPGQARSAVPGEVTSTVGLPALGSIEGAPKPLTNDEVRGAILGRLPQQDQRNAVLSSVGVTSVQGPNGPRYVATPDAPGMAPAPAAATPSNVKRLTDERAALPPGDPRIAEYDAAIAAEGRGATADPYRSASDTALAKRHAEIVSAGAAAANLTGNLDALEPLLNGVPTGALADRRVQAAKYAAAAGFTDLADSLTNGKLDEAQAANAIVQRMAPLLRVPGSGAQSDRELQNFLDSVPSLRNTPGGNKIIIGTMRAAAQRQQQAAEIARQAQSGALDKFEAERQIAALPSPLAAFKERAAGPGGAASTGGGTPAPGTGQQAQQPVPVASPDEARKLPSGTSILLPDGRVGRVP